MASGRAAVAALHAQSDSASQRPITRCQAPENQLLDYLRRFDGFFRGVGGTAAIALDGRLAFSASWGLANREERVPVRAETHFFIASVTKAFTGVALLRLSQERSIDLDAPIQTYVPSLRLPGAESITARLLAAHLAGVRHWKPEERDSAFLSRRYDSPAAVLSLLSTDTLLAPPGTRYHYSSLGYNIVAAAIEAAARRRFTEYVSEHVIRPAGLRHTRFDDVREALPDRSRGYSYWYPWFSRRSSDTLRPVPPFDYSVNPGGGNMLSTSEDLVRFGSALLEPGLLNADFLRRLRMPIAPGSPWTYGFVVDADSLGVVLRITGSDPGYQASLSVYPERRIAIALLQNSWGIRAVPPPEFADPITHLLSLCLGRTGS